MIRLHSVRGVVAVESAHESVDEALRAAFRQVEEGSAVPIRLTDADGRVVLEPLVFEGVVLHSVRYGVPVVSAHDTVEEAIRAALREVEHNSAAPVRITDAGGQVLGEEALAAAIARIAFDEWGEGW